MGHRQKSIGHRRGCVGQGRKSIGHGRPHGGAAAEQRCEERAVDLRGPKATRFEQQSTKALLPTKAVPLAETTSSDSPNLFVTEHAVNADC